MKLDKARTLKIIKATLNEDIGIGDVTTASVIPKLASIKAGIIVKEDCILCGLGIAEWIINTVDYSVRFKPQSEDGQQVYAGKEIAFLEGHARAILTAERTMLNFLSFLSGISTAVKAFVDKTGKYGVKIYDTRKTYPLLRYLEKYAVSVGGGFNHRMGLWDQVLVKDNHLKISALGKGFVRDLRKKIQKNMAIEVEVDNMRQYEIALPEGPDIIMLDNMSVADVRKAVSMRGGLKTGKKPILEVSGGITLENAEEYAKTGVDRISVGSLTDSVKSVDISLEIKP